MHLIFYIFVFLFGLIAGSFLNCVVYRLEKKQSFLKGRSYCPKCKHKLSWQELFPVLSFIILKGKCKHCKKKISWQYPAVEIATGIIFLLIFNSFGLVQSFYFSLISCLLIVIFLFDLKHYIIPDKVVFPAIGIVLLYQLAFNFKFLTSNSLWAGIGSLMFFLFIFLVSSGRWMGFGDVKLSFLMGLFLGWPNISVALFLAFFLGAIIGVALIIFKDKSFKSEIPFGPFLITGTFIALLFGTQLIEWYLHLFLL